MCFPIQLFLSHCPVQCFPSPCLVLIFSFPVSGLHVLLFPWSSPHVIHPVLCFSSPCPASPRQVLKFPSPCPVFMFSSSPGPVLMLFIQSYVFLPLVQHPLGKSSNFLPLVQSSCFPLPLVQSSCYSSPCPFLMFLFRHPLVHCFPFTFSFPSQGSDPLV